MLVSHLRTWCCHESVVLYCVTLFHCHREGFFFNHLMLRTADCPSAIDHLSRGHFLEIKGGKLPRVWKNIASGSLLLLPLFELELKGHDIWAFLLCSQAAQHLEGGWLNIVADKLLNAFLQGQKHKRYSTTIYSQSPCSYSVWHLQQ